MSIQTLVSKIKQGRALMGRQDIYMALLIVLVGLASFGLGRLSKIQQERPPVSILQPPHTSATLSDTTHVSVADGRFVASRNGSKYHFPWCAGARRIKEGNKIWFVDRGSAEAAGYTAAANCKGL